MLSKFKLVNHSGALSEEQLHQRLQDFNDGYDDEIENEMTEDEQEEGDDEEEEEEEEEDGDDASGLFCSSSFVPKTSHDLKGCAHCASNELYVKETDAAKAARALRAASFFTVDDTCQAGCERNCLYKLRCMDVMHLRQEFWASEPSASERRTRMHAAVSIAREQYMVAVTKKKIDPDDYPDNLLFMTGEVEVCEKSFVNALGLNSSTGYKSKTWRDVVDIFTGRKQAKRGRNNIDVIKREARAAKREHAYAYIGRTVESEVMDRSAFRGQGDTLFLPYSKLKYFYHEYNHYCVTNHIPERALESTFQRAFRQLLHDKKKDGITIKLSGGKGSFEKCDICHNADQLLRRRDNWSFSQIEIIQSYRRRHIQQQFEERVTLQNNIAETYKLDHNGQPVKALLFGDGMTVYTGNTPRQYVKGRSSKAHKHHITSRVIGVEVHCGPVHGTLLYYTDNLTKGGANAIIEVTRQAMLDLQDLLKNFKDLSNNPLDLPRALILQFDNCAENKNRFMFTYISMLVEEGIFDTVDVHFLIVGHTHASIDQYFSVLSNAIFASDFIGSPLALEHLYANYQMTGSPSGESWTDGKKVKNTPLKMRKISIVYDMKTAMKSLVNMKINYYPIPHHFRFEKIYGVVAMQYAIYSSQKELLPKRPDNIEVFEESSHLDIAFKQLDLVGGETKLLNECGAAPRNDRGSVFSESFRKTMNVTKTLSELGKDLDRLETEIVNTAMERTRAAELLDETHSAQSALAATASVLLGDVSSHLVKHNTSARGFICWLNPGVSRRLDPELLNFKEVLTYLMMNEEYESTGYDVFDIFHMSADDQYDNIMRHLGVSSGSSSDTWSKLSLNAYQRLKAKHFPGGIDRTIDCSKFVDATKEITKTAMSVLQDVRTRRLSAPRCDDFSYKEFALTKKEVVFYFHRATTRGVCLTLLKEFDMGRQGSYSILPLIRPTESNDQAAKDLLKDGDKRLSAFSTFTSGVLSRQASQVKEGQEVLSRPACDTTTRNAAGEKVLFRADTTMIAGLENSIGENRRKRKQLAGKTNGKEATLLKMKLDELQALASDENVQLEGASKRRKCDYVAAILKSRGQKSVEEKDSNGITAQEIFVSTVATDSEADNVAKQLLRVLNVKQLKDIARNEGIIVLSVEGSRTKEVFVEAIYSHRKGNS